MTLVPLRPEPATNMILRPVGADSCAVSASVPGDSVMAVRVAKAFGVSLTAFRASVVTYGHVLVEGNLVVGAGRLGNPAGAIAL